MARFYRRFDAPEHNPLLNAAVYAGIGAKLLASLPRSRPRANERDAASHGPSGLLGGAR